MSSVVYGLDKHNLSRVSRCVRSFEQQDGGLGIIERHGKWSDGKGVAGYPMGTRHPFGIRFYVEATSCAVILNRGVMQFGGLTPFLVDGRKFNIARNYRN